MRCSRPLLSLDCIGVLIGALLELLVFATPSILYLRSRRRRGHASGDVRAEVGWRLGNAIS